MNSREIKKLRKSLGLTAREFASELGFTGEHRHITVYRWERSEKPQIPSPQTVILMRKMKSRGRKKQ
jgi:DNA-binding transcriptional regulator YiaG